MRISNKIVGWSLFLILVASGSLQAQEKNPQEAAASCRKAMQGFYNQVVGKGPKSPSAVLSPELRRQLKDDQDNKMDENGLIQGLDFDPIAGGNDVRERYEVGKVTSRGNRYLVEIYGVWGKKRETSQKMVHEVIHSRGRWVIMNIHYYSYENGKLTGRSNLLTMLKELREARSSGTVTGVIERTESDDKGMHSIFFKVKGRMHQFQILDAKFIAGAAQDLQQGKRIQIRFTNRQLSEMDDFCTAKATEVRILTSPKTR